MFFQVPRQPSEQQPIRAPGSLRGEPGKHLNSFEDSDVQNGVNAQAVNVQTQANDTPPAYGRQKRAMPKILPLENIRYMYLNHGCRYGLQRIGQRRRAVGISAGIKHNTRTGKSDFVQLIDERSLVVRLKIVQLHSGEAAF